ncbi:MAG TPA: hypothetical protein VIA45_11325 [Thermoanaerobaculia bacterium]|jgi:hypothetical protein
MISSKAARIEPPAPPIMSEAPARLHGQRPVVTERGVPVSVRVDDERHQQRTILYERLTGEAARERARRPEPLGAGLPPEIVDQIEYIEVWSTPKEPAGYDFRVYSFGGALIASRSTRA